MPDTETTSLTIRHPSPDELSLILETGKEAIEFNKYFEFGELGATIKGDPPIEAWGATINALKTAGRMLPIWLGDLINGGEAKYGEKIGRASCRERV